MSSNGLPFYYLAAHTGNAGMGLTMQGTDVAAVIKKISESANDDDLMTALHDLPAWPYPRGEFHDWVTVLDRFDDVLGDIIASYDLAKLQTNDFTPKTKELLLEVLRVTRLLLENCTSRKLYSSYDVSCQRVLVWLVRI